MPTTSGTYAFNPDAIELLTEAYERIGIRSEALTAWHLETGRRSINYAFLDIANQQLNLWGVSPGVIDLVTGQSDYALPAGTVDLLECYRRTSTRQLDGTPATSAGGTAANAFDGDYTTSCTQTSTNGNISYDFGSNTTPTISMVGVRPNVTATYTLVVETSKDGSEWVSRLTVPAASYPASETTWLVILAPVASRYIRLREAGGGTLNLQELYFNYQTQDIAMGRMARSQYASLVDKTTTGTPTAFFVDRQEAPILRIWRPTDGTVTQAFYLRMRELQDVGDLSNVIDVPRRFLDAIVAATAVRLAEKFKPERMETAAAIAMRAYGLAASEDRDRAPMSFQLDFGGYIG